jgi:hypothetical protein
MTARPLHGAARSLSAAWHRLRADSAAREDSSAGSSLAASLATSAMSGATRFPMMPFSREPGSMAASKRAAAAEEVAADLSSQARRCFGCQFGNRARECLNPRQQQAVPRRGRGGRQAPPSPVGHRVKAAGTWPWLQASRHRRKGSSSVSARPRAKATPTRIPAKEPGPTVTPMRSMAESSTSAASSTDCRISRAVARRGRALSQGIAPQECGHRHLRGQRRRNEWPNNRLRV